jgi:heme exporter protein C
MSVRWWRTLHPQPIVVRAEGPAMPDTMLYTLVVALVAFMALYIFLLIEKYRVERMKDELAELRLQHGG